MTPIERVHYALDLVTEYRYNCISVDYVTLSIHSPMYSYPSLTFYKPGVDAADEGSYEIFDDNPLFRFDTDTPHKGGFEDGIKRLEEMINEHRTRHDST